MGLFPFPKKTDEVRAVVQLLKERHATHGSFKAVLARYRQDYHERSVEADEKSDKARQAVALIDSERLVLDYNDLGLLILLADSAPRHRRLGDITNRFGREMEAALREAELY